MKRHCPTPEAPLTNAIDEELLIVRCQLGERSAFDALVQRWHPSLWSYVRYLTGDDEFAAETVQDVWIRVMRGIAQLRSSAKFRPWLFGIARRVVMDRLRDKYAQPIIVTLEAEDVANVAIPEDDDLSEEIGLMHEELLQMPVAERDVLVLLYLKDLTLGDLSEILNIPVGTVKSRLFRARKTLREQLEKKGVQR